MDALQGTAKAPGGKSVLLKEQAYSVIKASIIDGSIKPGQLLSERQLTDLLQMSKTPIKSALDRLEAEGYVTVSPKQGILVNAFSLQRYKSLSDLRTALELFVIDKCCTRLPEQYKKEIRRNLKRQEIVAGLGDQTEFTELDIEFHRLFFKAYGSAELLRLMNGTQEQLNLAISTLNAVPNRIITSYAEHARIFESVQSGDRQASRDFAEAHLGFLSVFSSMQR